MTSFQNLTDWFLVKIEKERENGQNGSSSCGSVNIA